MDENESVAEQMAERFLFDDDKGYELCARAPSKEGIDDYQSGHVSVRAQDNINYGEISEKAVYNHVEELAEQFELGIDEALVLDEIPVIGGGLGMELREVLEKSNSTEPAYVYSINVNKRLESDGPISFSYDSGPFLTTVCPQGESHALAGITDHGSEEDSYARFLQSVISEQFHPNAHGIVEGVEEEVEKVLYDELYGVDGVPIKSNK